MFNSIKEKIQNLKARKQFNANNCLRQQNYIDKQNLLKRIDDIQARIKYVVESTTEEHAVIYQIHEYERPMWSEIDEHFTNLGFKLIYKTIEELNNDEYVIISWKN